MSSEKIFIHLVAENKSIIENEVDYKYLLDKELIKEKGSQIFTDFVGEVTTPNNNYISLPKGFNRFDKSNIDLIREVLKWFEEIKDPKWKSLLYNQYFEPKSDGDFESEKYFYKELKSYFLDYITYEFIYPLNKLKVHSGSPIKGGKLDVLSSVENRKRFGTGFTYNVKDVKNSDDWMIDDIYYHTLESLMNKYGTESEKRDIKEMKNYLDDEGYHILLDDSGNTTSFYDKYGNLSAQEIIDMIHKSPVGNIHYPIRDTLIEYYEGRKLVETKYTIRVFYSTNFEKVWEELVKKSLYNNKDFEKSEIGKYKNVETVSKWFPSTELMNKLSELSDKEAEISDSNPNIIKWKEKSYEPDIFSYYEFQNGKTISFIGDAKYINDVNSDFSKEMNDYNGAMKNKYPMCIFCCGEITTVNRKREVDEKELIIFSLSTKDAIKDAIDRKNGIESTYLLRRVHHLIRKYTSRKGPEFSGGF
jgi:hypothetical protein